MLVGNAPSVEKFGGPKLKAAWIVMIKVKATTRHHLTQTNGFTIALEAKSTG